MSWVVISGTLAILALICLMVVAVAVIGIPLPFAAGGGALVAGCAVWLVLKD